MTNAINISGLGKCYRIGRRADTAIAAVATAMRHPWRRLSEPFWALRDLDLSIECGEIVGIIGNNGAGKSTLLRILAGITRPSRGEARVRGTVGSLLEIGTGFHPELDGRENIALGGAVLGMSPRQTRRHLDEIVAFAGIDQHLDTPLKHWSTGMQARLGFAIAAHLEPDILIVDEVLSVGDLAFQNRCLGRMGELVREARTVLFVSHNMSAIRQLCSRAVLLRNGQKVADDDPEQVIAAHIGPPEPGLNERSLSDPSLHEGAGGVFIDHIALHGESVNGRIHSGGGCRFTMRYRSDRPHGNLQFAFRIRNRSGVPVFHANTGLMPLKQQPPDEGQISCRFPCLALPPGPYSVTPSVRTGATTVLDRIPEALSFEVEEGNYYPNGIAPNPQHAVALCDFVWSLP